MRALSNSGRICVYHTLAVRLCTGLSVASEGTPDQYGFRTIKLKTLNAEDSGEAILRACMSEGLRVRALSRAHPTLEDVFLAATRRSWDAVSSGPGTRT